MYAECIAKDNRLKEMSAEELEEAFEYLDDLRVSGETNMFGAAPYVQREFGVNQGVARAVLGAWMETYSERHPRA